MVIMHSIPPSLLPDPYVQSVLKTCQRVHETPNTRAPANDVQLPEAMVAESSDDTGAGRASEIVVRFSWTMLGNPHSKMVKGKAGECLG